MSNPHCRPPTPSDEEDDLYSEILRLEERTWRALSHSGTSLLPYLSADCVMQFPLGIKVTRDSTPSVRDLLHSPAFVPWSSFRLRDVDVADVGARGAVVSYRVEATKKGAAAGPPEPASSASASSSARAQGQHHSQQKKHGDDLSSEDDVVVVDDREDEDDEIHFEALCVSVWRWEMERRREGDAQKGERRGKWVMCFHQQTLTNA